MSRRIPAAQAQLFMDARARRFRRQRRDGGKIVCGHAREDKLFCITPATHVTVEGPRCKDHLEGAHYATEI